MRSLALPLALLAMARLSAGCGMSYTTAYRPPVDGRARVVWGPGGEAAVDTGGLPLTFECAAAIRQITGRASAPFVDGTRELPEPMPYAAYPPVLASGYVPAYYGAQVVAPSAILAPRIAVNAIYFGSLSTPGRTNPGSRPPGIGGGGGVITGGGTGGSHAPGAGHGGSGGGRSGGSGGGGNGSAAVIAAVVVALTLPLLDVGLAASTPESGTRMSAAADVVNAWNDLARTPGSPCALGYGLAVVPAPMPSGAIP